jgi:putative tricarboxylic transport membrane protein
MPEEASDAGETPINRRRVRKRMSSRLAAAFCSLALIIACATSANAQSELKIMAPASPGGGWDSTARAMQQAMMSAGIAKSVQVTNVTGAGGIVGLAQLVNQHKGNGNQLMVNGFVMVGAILANKAPVTLAQTTPIARLTEEAEVIVVPANSRIKSAQDLADALKADPAKVTFGGCSAGGTDHVVAALFAKAAGADATRLNYIPFSGGGESLAAIIGGKVTAGISGPSEYEGQIRAGKLKAIAVTSASRVAGIDAPTLKEQGFDLVVTNWRSVVAPPGLSQEQTETLARAVETMAASREWKEIVKARGWDESYLGGSAFAAFLQAENERVGEVLKSVGIGK